MSANELVLKTLRKMSAKATMDEIVEELAILAAIRRGEETADEGRVLSHDEMKKRVSSWNTRLDFWGNPVDDEDWNIA